MQPTSLDDRYVRGVSLLERGRLDQAASLLEQAAADPTALAARRRLGECLVRQERFEAAEPWLRDLLARRPDDREATFYLGVALQGLDRDEEALGRFLTLLEGDPDDWRAWYHAALSMELLGHLDDAASAFEQVTRIRPGFAEGWLHLGLILAERATRTRPAQCFAKAADLAPERPGPRYLLGFQLLQAGQVQDAEDRFAEALALDPACREAIAGRALIHLRRKEIDPATELLREHALVERPNPLIAHAWAEACKRRKAPREAIPVVQRALAGSVSRQLHLRLHHDLGDLHDALDEADQAFAAFAEANRARDLAFDIDRHARAVAHVQARYTAEALAEAPRATRTTDRAVLIVGMPRSGTSLTEQILASHPEAAGAGELETLRDIAFHVPKLVGGGESYVDGFHALTPAILDELADLYLQRLDRVDPDARRITDKMPHNFLHLGLAAQLLPTASVVHVVRDPLDTLWSCFRKPFGAGLAYTTSLEGLGHWYAHYRQLMDHWKQVLPIPIHEVRYEDLVTDPEPTVRGLLDHVGLDWDPACLRFHQSRRLVATASWAQVQQPLHTRAVGRAEPYREHLRPTIRILEDAGIDV